MSNYTVYITDKFTKIPLGCYYVKALTKWGAKRKVYKEILGKDTTMLLVASKVKK